MSRQYETANPPAGRGGVLGNKHCLVYYERGGIARTWRVALFHWTPDTTRFEWGGAAPGGLVTIEDVRGAVLSDRWVRPGFGSASVTGLRGPLPAFT